MAEKVGDAATARKKVVGSLLKMGSITTLFDIQGKKKKMYSNVQHTKMETR
jgi:hypothetical protein